MIKKKYFYNLYSDDIKKNNIFNSINMLIDNKLS